MAAVFDDSSFSNDLKKSFALFHKNFFQAAVVLDIANFLFMCNICCIYSCQTALFVFYIHQPVVCVHFTARRNILLVELPVMKIVQKWPNGLT